MSAQSNDLVQRIERLERQLRRARTLLGAGLLVGAAVALVAATAVTEPEGLRARSLTIVDEQGTERIIIAAPLPSPAGEANPRFLPATGMMINDSNGRERFGIGLYPNGQMTMGFDAAPGQGTGGNRERLHLGVMPDGTSFIRFLSQRSGLAGRMLLNKQDKVALEFWDQQGTVMRRGALDVDGWKRLPDYPIPQRK